MYIRNNKGITLIALIITIILMLILTGVGVSSGIESYKNAQVSKFVAQMQLIQEKVDSIDENTGGTLGTELDDKVKSKVQNIISSENLFSKELIDWRYLDTKDLQLEDIQDNLFINFKTREVISTTGIYYNGKKHYTQYSLPGGQTLTQNTNKNTETLTCEMKIDYHGLGATITISNIKLEDKLITNGVLKYKKLENYISEVTYNSANSDSTDYWHEIQGNRVEISKSGYYVFCLSQNEKKVLISNSLQGTFKLEPYIILFNYYKVAQNMSYQNSDDIIKWYKYNDYDNGSWNWKYGDIATYNENYYVWIPRCAYIEETQIVGSESYIKYKVKYLKGNSNIPTDGTVLDDSWKVPAQFSDTNTNQEYRGIWLKANLTSDSDAPFLKKLLSEGAEYISVE